MEWTTQRYPALAEPIRALAAQHRELEDEPLHLAIAFDPGREPEDVFLFELLGRFGLDEVGRDRELFEVTFPSTTSFPMGGDRRLHLILTNRKELQAALRDGWQTAEELRRAVRRGDYELLYADEIGSAALSLIRG